MRPELIPTPAAERARLGAALAEELVRSLQQLPEVRTARVHLVIPAPNASLLGEPQLPAKASILLLLEPGSSLLDEPELRALAAGAVAGLAPEGVTVVQRHATGPSQPTPTTASEAAEPASGAERSWRWILLALLCGQLLLAAAMLVLHRRLRALEIGARSGS